MSKNPTTCEGCKKTAELIYGVDLFPGRHDLAEKPFWVCSGCESRVGCHPNTHEPLGVLADAATRRARSEVHRALDPHWLKARNKGKARVAVYARLAKGLGIADHECHVGMFSTSRCREALEIIREWT